MDLDLYKDYGDIAEALLDFVEHRTTDQADAPMQVPVASYLDPARFDREIALIFRKLPPMLALTAEMPKAGDYKAMDAIGLPVLITRGRDGAARAFLNVCKHRAMHIARQGKGNCSRFACQYHGWTYANDGHLVGIAEGHTFGDVDKAALALTELPCQEVAGMIFVVLTPGEPIDVPAFLGPMLDDLAALKLETWYYHKSLPMKGANWKVSYDGYLEGYHFAAAHPDTVTPRSPSNRAHYTGLGPHVRIAFPQVSIPRLHQLPREDWGKQENRGYDFIRLLFPNFSLFVAPEMTQFAQLFPGPTPGENTTVLNYIAPRKPGTEAEMKAFDEMCDFFYNVVLEEDYALGLKVQNGLESGAITHVTFGRNERGNQYFHKWLAYYLSDPATRTAPSL